MLARFFALFAAAVPQLPGELVDFEKISSTRGGFVGPLENSDQLGRAVASLGDLDGDDVGDLAISAHGSDDGGTDRGAVWICFMNRDGTVRAQQKISSTSGGFGGQLHNDDELGRSIANIGDLDGDGTIDLAVGAVKSDDGGRGRGSLWILFLNDDGTVRDQQKISNLEGGFTGVLRDGDQFGRSVTAIGDLDGDGSIELAVGAIYDDDGGPDRGAVWIVTLTTDGTVTAQTKISAITGGLGDVLSDRDHFGMSVARLGDLDQDGVPDLVVGAAGDNEAGGDAGALYVLYMTPGGSVRDAVKVGPASPGFGPGVDWGDWFGYSVSAIGDVDGDGVTELAVGAWGDDDPGLWSKTNSGAVWIVSIDRAANIRGKLKYSAFTPAIGGRLEPDDWFGSSVAGLGDHDGDGFYDLAVGARFDDDGAENDAVDRGACYILFLAGAFPTADFDAQPLGAHRPFGIALNNRSRGVLEHHEWDFGDGRSSTAVSPTHVYGRPGDYRVTLSVSGPGRVNSALSSDWVHIAHPDPPGNVSRTAPKPVPGTDDATEDTHEDTRASRSTARPIGASANPAGSLRVAAGIPAVGERIVLSLGSPAATAASAPFAPSLMDAGVVFVSLATAPRSQGAALAHAVVRRERHPLGELLVRLDAGSLLGVLAATRNVGARTPTATLTIPPLASLAGTTLYVQGLLIAPDGVAPGGRHHLTNALELNIGR